MGNCIENQKYKINTVGSPLENILVLETIFKFCKVKTLKRCRLVSKLWRDGCQKAFRESGTVNLVNLSGAAKYKMEKYIDFVEQKNNGCALFTKYSLSFDLPVFWQLCGSNIHTLKLSFCKLQNVESYRFIIFSACPNMKSLSLQGIDICDTTGSEAEHHFQPNNNLRVLKIYHLYKFLGVTWTEFLSHFPFLQAIELNGSIYKYDQFYKSIVSMRQQNPEQMKLKSLRLYSEDSESSELSDGLFDLLVNTGLQLETLALQIEWKNGEAVLRDILTANRAELKSLSLTRYNGLAPLNPFKSFPVSTVGKLEKLKKLFLETQVFASYAFLHFMPNLEYLCNESGLYTELAEVSLSNKIDVKVTKCRTLAVGYTNEFKSLNNLVQWFPNVEDLHIAVNTNEEFGLVCQSWPNLTSLRITFFWLDDSGLTGLDQNDVEKINREGGSGSWVPTTVRRPNITSLKHLRNFGARKPVILRNLVKDFGYCAAVHGIQNLSNLCHLQMSYSTGNDLWKDLLLKHPWNEFE